MDRGRAPNFRTFSARGGGRRHRHATSHFRSAPPGESTRLPARCGERSLPSLYSGLDHSPINLHQCTRDPNACRFNPLTDVQIFKTLNLTYNCVSNWFWLHFVFIPILIYISYVQAMLITKDETSRISVRKNEKKHSYEQNVEKQKLV